jgi:hypothetical protein
LSAMSGALQAPPVTPTSSTTKAAGRLGGFFCLACFVEAVLRIYRTNGKPFRSAKWSTDLRGEGDTLLTLRILGSSRLGCVMSFQITVLKVLAGHLEGRASIAEIMRYVSILISSGTDWTNRTKRLAARAPKLDIFADSFVLRGDNGWHRGWGQFLASLEAPLPIVAPPVQAPEPEMTKQPRSPEPARPKLRLVVNNDKQAPDGRERPSRRSA